MNEREPTATDKFVELFGAFIMTVSRRQLGMVSGPRNVDYLYERFSAAWQECYPGIPVPECKQ